MWVRGKRAGVDGLPILAFVPVGVCGLGIFLSVPPVWRTDPGMPSRTLFAFVGAVNFSVFGVVAILDRFSSAIRNAVLGLLKMLGGRVSGEDRDRARFVPRGLVDGEGVGSVCIWPACLGSFGIYAC